MADSDERARHKHRTHRDQTENRTRMDFTSRPAYDEHDNRDAQTVRRGTFRPVNCVVDRRLLSSRKDVPLVPRGTFGNSPPIHRWEYDGPENAIESRQGTKESLRRT